MVLNNNKSIFIHFNSNIPPSYYVYDTFGPDNSTLPRVLLFIHVPLTSCVCIHNSFGVGFGEIESVAEEQRPDKR